MGHVPWLCWITRGYPQWDLAISMIPENYEHPPIRQPKGVNWAMSSQQQSFTAEWHPSSRVQPLEDAARYNGISWWRAVNLVSSCKLLGSSTERAILKARHDFSQGSLLPSLQPPWTARRARRFTPHWGAAKPQPSSRAYMVRKRFSDLHLAPQDGFPALIPIYNIYYI